MKLFLLFFMFFLGLSSFTAGWILRGKYKIAPVRDIESSNQKRNEPPTSMETLSEKTVGKTKKNKTLRTALLTNSSQKSSSLTSTPIKETKKQENKASLKSQFQAIKKTEETVSKERHSLLKKETLQNAKQNVPEDQNKSRITAIPEKSISKERNNPLKKKESQNTKQNISKNKSMATENSEKIISEKRSNPVNEKLQKTKQSTLKKENALLREKKYQKFNKKEFTKIENQQSFFTREGQYSFLINAFSKEKPALEYIEKLKTRFPVWNFFIRPDKIHLRVYLGPFKTKREALEFINKITAPSPFPNYFLEKETLSLNEF